VENGDSPAAGKALAIRRHVSGLPWYEDAATGTIRTAEGDLCVHADQGLLNHITSQYTLSVDSNQNVESESKRKSVESKIGK